MCGPSPTEILKNAETPLSYKQDSPRLLLVEALEVAARNCPGDWHAVVVDDRETLARLAEMLGVKLLGEAPYAVVVAAPQGSEHEALRASVYIEVAARFLDLAPLWMAARGIDGVLELPDKLRCVALVALGKAGETREQGGGSLRGRIHFNRYGGTAAPVLLQGLLKAKGLV